MNTQGFLASRAPVLRRGAGCRKASFALALFGLLLPAAPAPAQHEADDRRSGSQLADADLTHTAWIGRDGAPGSISALAQTRDGYLWIGSSLGLYRFDGIRFVAYPFGPGVPPLPSLDVSSLAADPDAGLWVGLRTAGVLHLRADGSTVSYGRASGLISDTLDKIYAPPDGSVWVIAGGRLLRLERDRWIDFGRAHGLEPGAVVSALFDHEGSFWVGQVDRLSVLRHGTDRFTTVPLLTHLVTGIAVSPAGRVWIGDAWHSVQPVDSRAAHPTLAGVPLDGRAEILIDSRDNLWVAQDFYGLQRRPHIDDTSPGKAPARSLRQSLTSTQTSAVLEDREGDLWVGTARGLDRFQTTSFAHLRGASLNFFPALTAGHDGSVWINSTGSPLLRVLHGEEKTIGPPVNSGPLITRRNGDVCILDATAFELQCHGAQRDFAVMVDSRINRAPPQSMVEDADGSLLISFQGKGLWRYNGAWQAVEAPGLPFKATWAMFLDSGNRLWLGYPNNEILMRDGTGLHFLRVEGDLWSNTLTFYEGAGVLWAGGSTGLSFFDGQQFRRVRGQQDDLLRGISGIVLDRLGNLWLNAGPGAVRISAAEIDALRRNPSHPVAAELFDEKDGILGPPTQFKPTPSAIADRAGTLWFATGGDVVSLDPAKLETRESLPQVLIENVALDGVPLPATATGPGRVLKFNARTLHDLEIGYIGIHLSAPERVSYRYRLVGEDRDWQEVGTRRQAFYTRLSPGAYQFQVSARVGGGRWSDLAMPLHIRVEPAFYQTALVRTLAVLLLLGLLWAAYLVRVRQLTARMRLRHEERTEERLRIARELHDTLLQSIHGLMLRFHYAAEVIPASEPAHGHLSVALAHADEVISEGRRRVQNLRTEPPAPGNFAAELARLGTEMYAEGALAISVIAQGRPRPLLPSVQQELLLIVREALINILQHAHATQATVELIYGAVSLRLRCRDDGIGMNAEMASAGRAGHWGLVGMQERARSIGAALEVSSAPGRGTEVYLRIPAFRSYQHFGIGQDLLRRLARNP